MSLEDTTATEDHLITTARYDGGPLGCDAGFGSATPGTEDICFAEGGSPFQNESATGLDSVMLGAPPALMPPSATLHEYRCGSGGGDAMTDIWSGSTAGFMYGYNADEFNFEVSVRFLSC